MLASKQQDSYRCSAGATLAGGLTIPQTSALSVKNSTGDGNPIHMPKEKPVAGISYNPVI